jgi:V/A-type H+/Na+-transporting ATPase subunit I
MTLNPIEMERIIVAGPNSILENVIKELHKLKILHIVEHSKNKLSNIGRPLIISEKYSQMLVDIRSLINIFSLKTTDFTFKPQNFNFEDKIKIIFEEHKKNVEDISKLDELLSKNKILFQGLRPLKDINIPLGMLKPYESLVLISRIVGESMDIDYIKDSLSKLTPKFFILTGSYSENIAFVLFVDKAYCEQANAIIEKVKNTPFQLNHLDSGILDQNNNSQFSLRKLELQKEKLEKMKSDIYRRDLNLGQTNQELLLHAEYFLSNELEKSNAPLKFGATDKAFIVKGWVPKENLGKIIDGLNNVSEGKAYIQHNKPDMDDAVPVKLNNHKMAKPFELFINMFSLPGYREIDPTYFMFLTFPIFFGFMLGDFGYGILSFALFWFMKKRLPKLSNFLNIMILSSISSIIFGFIYGEFFGFEELGHFHIPHLLSRSHGITELMIMAIAIGIIHINWGLVAGFVNLLKNHGIKHALLEKGSWFVLQVGIGFIIASYQGYLTMHPLIGWLILGVSIFMLYKGEGIKGLIEIPGLLSNSLSYLRLMAIGLSSVSIAIVVNEMAEGFFHEGGLLILAGILVMLVGHLLNILLGLFGSFLHSLRLHYVEFFSKFFHGSGLKYKPFGEQND